MTAIELLERLRGVSPRIAFSIELTRDPNYVWDGYGPDPEEQGYLPHDVDVLAVAIHEGKLVEGRSSMGGHYFDPDKGPPDLDVSGYLPQMLREAAEELASKMPERGEIRLSCEWAISEISKEMELRYAEQRKALESYRHGPY